MRITTLELLLILACCIAALAAFSGCSHSPVITNPSLSAPQQCCQRLDIRDTQLRKYERLCIALAFLEHRFPNDARAIKNIKEGLELCRYVYLEKR